MSKNRNLWTLQLPTVHFVDMPHSVIHYTGVEISNKVLEEESRLVLRKVGEEIKKFSVLLDDEQRREYLVRCVNRSRETLGEIYRWLEPHMRIRASEDLLYLPEDVIQYMKPLLDDPNFKVPCFDSRFLKRRDFPTCLQAVYAENEQFEKDFDDLIVHSGFRRFVEVQIVYHDTAIPPPDAYRITVKQVNDDGTPSEPRKLLRNL